MTTFMILGALLGGILMSILVMLNDAPTPRPKSRIRGPDDPPDLTATDWNRAVKERLDER